MTTNTGDTELRRRLRDADPLAAEPLPSAEEVQAARRAMLAAATRAPAMRARHYATAALAATLAIAAALGVAGARRFSAARDDSAQPPAAAAARSEPTQVQFSTPGGTRIIWTIDPAFRLREAP